MKTVGVAGVGAIGGAVVKALKKGIEGFELVCVSDPHTETDFNVPNVSFEILAEQSDLVIECLPVSIVPELAEAALHAKKDVMFISSAALLTYPQLVDKFRQSPCSAYLPSGALCGLDGVRAMKEMGITSSVIASTKPPLGFTGAPYIVDNSVDLNSISEKTLIFRGNALEAARGFPANVNVAATLSFAGIGPEQTQVEVWADPEAIGNAHNITVQSEYSTLNARIENMPDPQNPKSSVLAAQSIVASLRNMNNALMLT